MPKDKGDPAPPAAGPQRTRGEMKSFLDVRTPFFRPLWRRVLATAICIAWALYELSSGSVFWAILFGSAGALMAWQFFITFDDIPDEGGRKEN